MKIQPDIVDAQNLIGTSQVPAGGIGAPGQDSHLGQTPAGLDGLLDASARRPAAPDVDPGETLLLSDTWGEAGAAGRTLPTVAGASADGNLEATLAHVLEFLR